MAYMNQERKAKIAARLKPLLKQYGVKGTLAVRHHSTIVLNLQSGPPVTLNATMKRNRTHDTALAFHLRRLKLTLHQAQRITRAPYGDLKNWKQGRHRTPRPILRLLAAYRLRNWGRFKKVSPPRP